MKISPKKITAKTTILLAICALAFAGAASARAEDSVKYPTDIRATLKAKLENRVEANKDIRNTQLEMRKDIKDIRASTTDMMKQNREDTREGMKMVRASTTDMFRKNMRQEVMAKMKIREFEIRKNALLHQFNTSINNLTNISLRIQTRITKVEGEGKVMTEAKALLVTADEKLAKAKADVAIFQALTASSTIGGTSVTASTTAEIDLTKPRVAGDAAIKSIKDARDAYQKVVVAIAHAMGVGINASSTLDVR